MSGEHRNQAAPPSSGDMKSPLLPLQEAISSQQTESSRFHFRIRSLLTLNYLFIVLGPLLSLLISLFVRFDGAPASSQKMLAVIVWVFTWWLTEAMPLPVTSMSPLFLFPLFGIASADRVAQSYMSDVITLILGSFILAFAVERYNVHRRLALNVGIIFCGDPVNPPLLLFGITAMSFFVSMWMHNVAATVMMMPIANGIIRRFPPSQEQSETLNKFCRAVVLAVVYGTAIGGTSTLTGTGVNLILAGMWKSLVPQGTPINFNTWFFFGFPFAALLGLSFWCLLCFFYVRRGLGKTLSTYFDRAHLKTDLQHMGPMAFAEKMVLIAFGVLILLWMTRRITDDIPGWGVVFHDLVGDGTVSVLVATLLFIIPNMKQEGEKLMDWEECKKLPWNLVLLLGAGFALADGVESSGLADVLSRALGFLQNAPYLLIVPMVSLLSSLITELITSNDATATLVVPLFYQMARTMHVHPLLLMVPGAISTEFAYWLPTSAPSNVVGFSSGHIEVKDMLKIGLPLKFIGIAILSLLVPTLGAIVFGVNDGTQWFTSHKDRLSP